MPLRRAEFEEETYSSIGTRIIEHDDPLFLTILQINIIAPSPVSRDHS